MNAFRQIFMMLAFGVGLLLYAGMATTPAIAASITFNFTGHVTKVGSQVSDGTIAKHQPVTGSYTFESTTGNSGSGTTGEYKGALNDPLNSYPSTNLKVFIGSPVTYAALLGAGANEIEVKNPSGLNHDSYEVEGALAGPTVKGLHPKSFELELEHPSTNQFNGVLLPLTPPNLSSFKEKTLRLVFGYGGDYRTVTIKLDTLTAVPLPPAVILFGAGLVALIGLGARNWRRTSGVRLEV